MSIAAAAARLQLRVSVLRNLTNLLTKTCHVWIPHLHSDMSIVILIILYRF